MPPHVAFMTVQYDHVQSGPGTFVNYVESRCENVELTIFSQDLATPDARHRQVAPSPLAGWPGGQFARSWAYQQALAEAQEDSRFDLVWYNSSPKTGLFSVLLERERPVVLMINDYNNAISRFPLQSRDVLGGKQSILRPLWRVFEKWTLRACDAVVVNSRFMKKAVVDWYGVEEKKLFLLYKAVDLETFEFSPARTLEEPVEVLFVKKDHRRGGLPELIEALSRLPIEVQLTVAGPADEDREPIEQQALEHDFESALHFVGRVSRPRVRNLFATHDLFCVPSRAEALGVVFLEALASGIPAIGTTVGGIPEVLDHGRAGWMVPPQSARALQNTIEKVIRNPKVRERKVAHGRTHAETFSVGRMVRRMEEIVQHVLQRQSAREGSSADTRSPT
ncbi:MAG: glycosyltransferase family 4 protein [Salinivenus sp.]